MKPSANEDGEVRGGRSGRSIIHGAGGLLEHDGVMHVMASRLQIELQIMDKG